MDQLVSLDPISMTKSPLRHPGVTFESPTLNRLYSGFQYDTVHGRRKFDDGHPNGYPQEHELFQSLQNR
jgi:hypothetical protein